MGVRLNPETDRTELNGVGGLMELITSGAYLSEYVHVITSAQPVIGSFVAGTSIWRTVRTVYEGFDKAMAQSHNVWRPIARLGLTATLIGGFGAAASGHIQGQGMVEVQLMKMVVAEDTCADIDGAAPTIAQFGSCLLGDNGVQPTQLIKVPGVASFMLRNSFTATPEGVADVQERMVELLNPDADFAVKHGDASQYDFRPPQMVASQPSRFMVGLGMPAFLLAARGLWATRGGRTSPNKWLSVLALVNLPLPFVAASFGWTFTEMGRQPQVVAPNLRALSAGPDLGSVNMMTGVGIPPNVPAGQMFTLLILFTLLCGVLGVIQYILMKRYTVEGTHSSKADKIEDNAPADLSFGY